jgi:hypothetical protein
VQRRVRGFDDTELWSLDHSLAKLILPRLKAFRNGVYAYPCDLSSHKEWQTILDKMIDAFEFAASEDYWSYDTEPCEKFHEGLKLFEEYYTNLWW